MMALRFVLSKTNEPRCDLPALRSLEGEGETPVICLLSSCLLSLLRHAL